MTKPTREKLRADLRWMLNKVPEVTLYFWVIKVLCTTVGETASDYLIRQRRPRPHEDDVHHRRRCSSPTLVVPVPRAPLRRRASTGSAIVLISVVGTQITDNLTDNFGVSLVDHHDRLQHRPRDRVRRLVRRASGRCRSTRSTRRGARRFYWLAVLFTFALGTAAGDLTAERLNLGYARLAAPLRRRDRAPSPSLHYRFGLNAVAVVLDRLHPHPAARRVDRRLPLAAARATAASASARPSRARSSSARSSSSSPTSAVTRTDVYRDRATRRHRRTSDVLVVAHTRLPRRRRSSRPFASACCSAPRASIS